MIIDSSCQVSLSQMNKNAEGQGSCAVTKLEGKACVFRHILGPSDDLEES